MSICYSTAPSVILFYFLPSAVTDITIAKCKQKQLFTKTKIKPSVTLKTAGEWPEIWHTYYSFLKNTTENKNRQTLNMKID